MTLLPGPTGMSEIRDDILTDMVLEADAAGITESAEPGSDNYVWATGVAGCMALAHARINSVEDAQTPVDAVGDDLKRWQTALRLPDVAASKASGKIVLTVAGTATVPDGQVFTLPNGLRGHVVGSWAGVTDSDEVDVTLDVAGTKGNLGAGQVVTFLNPPINVAPEATVSGVQPLTGGFDDEDEARLRERVLNRFAFVPGGGNIGQMREIAFNASPAVQQAYVYPALGGPATEKVVVLKKFDRDNHDYSRSLSTAGVSLVRDQLHAAISTGVTLTTQTAASLTMNVALHVTLPNSAQSGGSGDGWLDVTPWPQLVSATVVTVTSVTSAGVVTCNADTTTAPINGQTRFAWWSPNDMRFHVRTVTSSSGGTGAWVLTLDAPFVDSRGLTPAAGQYLSPAAEHMADYGVTWLNQMEALGPGENTSDTALIGNGRSLRKPSQADGGARMGLTVSQLNAMTAAHPEIDDIAYGYRSVSTPTVPGAVATAPNVLVPNNFGIYLA